MKTGAAKLRILASFQEGPEGPKTAELPKRWLGIFLWGCRIANDLLTTGEAVAAMDQASGEEAD